MGKANEIFRFGRFAGITQYNIDGRNGTAYKFPRDWLETPGNITDFDDACMTERRYRGVYFLFDSPKKQGKENIYVGKSTDHENGMLGRIGDHGNDEQDWFDEAVAFTSTEPPLTEEDVAYLENSFYNLLDADRYEIVNGEEPHLEYPEQERKGEMDGFIENARAILKKAGHMPFKDDDDVR